MKYTFLFFLSAFVTIQGFANDTLRVNAKTNEAMFLLEGAKIQSNVASNIKSGENILLIGNLPTNLDPQSIRIKTDSHVRIESIDPHINPNTLGVDALDDIKKKQEAINKKKLQLNNQLKALQEEMQLLKSNYNIKGNETLSKDRLKIIADFYRTRMKDIYDEKLNVQYQLHALDEQLSMLNDSVAARQNRKKPYGEIELRIQSAKTARTNFNISYYIPNAGWSPAYDIIIESTDKPLVLKHKALVQQNTGKAWKNIKAGVSNANPTLTNEKPDMRIWYVGNSIPNYGTGKRKNMRMQQTGKIEGYVYNEKNEPVPFSNVILYQAEKQISGTVSDINGSFTFGSIKSGKYSLVASSIGYKKARSQTINVKSGSTININIRMQTAVNQLDEIRVESSGFGRRKSKAKSAKKSDLAVTAEGLQKEETFIVINNEGINETQQSNRIEYRFDKKYTISGDNRQKHIDLKTTKINADFTYYALPVFAEEAFLVAEIPGWEKIKLLKGDGSIFFENTWVGATDLSPQTTKDTFKLSIARDPGVVVKKELENHDIKRNLLGKTKRETYEWTISIKNTKPNTIKINIEDQIPVSKYEDKTVELIESTGASHKKEKGFLLWELDLKSGQSKDITIKYSIEK